MTVHQYSPETIVWAIDHDWHSHIMEDVGNVFTATEWCEKNCKSPWTKAGTQFWFESNNDATLFKLTWE